MTRTLGLLLGAATVVAAVGVKLSGDEPRERERERQGRYQEPQAANGACGQQRRARQQLVLLGEHARPVGSGAAVEEATGARGAVAERAHRRTRWPCP